jgi:signal transduction histidine kinase
LSVINPRFNPRADDMTGGSADHGATTTTDYLINAVFLLIIVRQAWERELDLRSVVVPLALVAFVAHTGRCARRRRERARERPGRAAAALSGTSSAGVLATTLLCALLGLIAHFVKQARASQEHTEVLLAQLEDARDEQARAAAVAKRGRIAGELHGVLTHSLSGAAIQRQGARMLAEREQA